MSAKQHSDDDVPQRFDMDDEEALPSPNDNRELHDQIEILNKTLREVQDKADDSWQRLLRKEAELQNIIRRAEEDVKAAKNFAIERFAKDILQVGDSLDQGLHYSDNAKVTVETLVEGMTLTQNAFMNVLEKNGIKVLDPINQPFDPNFHEALTMQETSDVPPNQILQVIQKGYLLNERLLRPARVIVSKAPA